MKKKYFITIIEVKTGFQHNLVSDESRFSDIVKKELGEDALATQITNSDIDEDFLICAGITKDNSKAFSIICLMLPE